MPRLQVRAKVRKRQNIRRLEIIAIVVVIGISLVVGIYLAVTASDPRSKVDGLPLTTKDMNALKTIAASSSYGLPGTGYWQSIVSKGYLGNLTGAAFYKDSKPIIVYIGADYCPFCAMERWSLTIALMRFGNFSDLRYMTSGFSDGDYSTVTYYPTTYHSSYLFFQPFEVRARDSSVILQPLPANYSAAFKSKGNSAFPFLNFANKYYLSGAPIDPSALGSLNQTQIIASIQSANTLGSEIKQGANIFTELICKTTGDRPSSVCENPSIVGLKTLPVSYTLPSGGQQSVVAMAGPSRVLATDRFSARPNENGWN